MPILYNKIVSLFQAVTDLMSLGEYQSYAADQHAIAIVGSDRSQGNRSLLGKIAQAYIRLAGSFEYRYRAMEVYI